MFDHINHWLRTLPEKLRQLPPLQRFAALGLPTAGLSVLVVMVTLWGGDEKEQQQVLYSQLNMQDAGAIAAKLKEMKVPYTLKGDGTTILVPGAMVLDARLRLATEGLPPSNSSVTPESRKRNFAVAVYSGDWSEETP